MPLKFPTLRQNISLVSSRKPTKVPVKPSAGTSHPLNRYTMNVSRADSLNTANSQRDHKTQVNEGIGKAEIVSGSLARYGKRLFDDAVYRVKHGEADGLLSRRRAESWHNGPFKNTGPTKIGSPIYNKRVRLMNSIRTRPHTSVERYNHEKSKKLPEIEQTIRKYNDELRVMCPTQWSTSANETHQTTTLVKLAVDDKSGNITSSTINKGSLSDGTCSKRSDIESVDGMTIELHNELPTAFITTLDSPVPGAEVQEIIPAVSISSSLYVSLIDDTRPHTAPENNRPRSARKGETVARISSARIGSSRSRSRKLRCWVDDVTVSSVIEEPMPESETVVNFTMPNDIATGVANIVLNKNDATVTKTILKGDENNNLGEEKGDNPDATVKTVISLKDIQDNDLTLPDFICPSSEGKSKKAAIKQWLLHTSFTMADKSIPLV